MDDEREEFLDIMMEILAEARSKMTPIQRAFSDVRFAEIMERSCNSFWIRYGLKDTGCLLLTREQLQEKGREDEIKLLWLLKHAPFSFKVDGAGCEDRTRA